MTRLPSDPHPSHRQEDWVDIGDRAFELDTADHDDRERNTTEGYAIWAPDVRRQDVKRTLAGRSWDLDNPDRDDFERGRTDTFDLDPGIGLYRSAIASVRIHKSPDGIAGGWRLKGVEVIVNGSTIYTNQSINR
ncbi:MAG: hypothetical protein ACT4OQ_09785, partial [Chloroflexota bacterium]